MDCREVCYATFWFIIFVMHIFIGVDAALFVMHIFIGYDARDLQH